MIPDIFNTLCTSVAVETKTHLFIFPCNVMFCLYGCIINSLDRAVFNVYIDLTSYQQGVWTFSTRTMSGAGFLCRQISSTRWVTPAWSTKDRNCINSAINLQEGSVIGTVCIHWLLGLCFCGKMELNLHFPLGFKFFNQIVSVPWNMNK